MTGWARDTMSTSAVPPPKDVPGDKAERWSQGPEGADQRQEQGPLDLSSGKAALVGFKQMI